jgi:GrpB-like predicted nucleotidyltransferase (UPF0157 family)
MTPTPIGPYVEGPAHCADYDPRAARVADEVAAVILGAMPGLRIEHVGSTAVPGCAGKGVVDLLIVYTPGRLDDTVAGLDALGFQPQTSGNPFPQERPMRRGTFGSGGAMFRVHVHVIREGAAEVEALVKFRDRLRTDAKLLAAYIAEKRAILAAGVTDTGQYSNAKGGFIRGAIADSRPV